MYREQKWSQRTVSKTEEQEMPQKKELNEMDEMKATKISEAEFKRMIIRMLKNLRGRMDDLSKKDSKH